MIKTIKLLFFATLTALLYSCSQSSDVISSNVIQKRKYNKGFFADFGKKLDKATASNKTSVKNNEPASSSINGDELNYISETDYLVEVKRNDVFVKKAESKNESQKQLIEINNVEPEEVDFNNPNLNTNYTYISEDDGSEPKYGFLGTLLLVILALFAPALAVLIYEGGTTRFWLVLILNLGGYALASAGILGLGGLMMLVAFIWALLIIVGAV